MFYLTSMTYSLVTNDFRNVGFVIYTFVNILFLIKVSLPKTSSNPPLLQNVFISSSNHQMNIQLA